jgi:hypothetical protein
MKRAVIAAIVLSLAFALPAFAAESNQPPKGQAPTFEQKKTQILKSLDERSAKIQEERNCVKAAKKDDDLKACRNKFGPPHGPGDPAGMGPPGAHGGSPPPGGPPPKVSPPE